MNNSIAPPKAPPTGLWWFGVIVFLLFGLAWSILFLVAMLSPSDGKTDMGALWFGLICFGGLPTLLGIVFLVIVRRKISDYRERHSAWLQQATLHLASDMEGRVSAADIVMHLHVTPQEASRELESLAVAGLAEPLVSPSGTVVYQIRGLGKDKSDASEI